MIALHGPGRGDKYLIPPPARPYVDELGADPGRVRIQSTVEAWSGASVAPECRAAVDATALALDRFGHDVDAGSPALDPDVLHRGLMTTWAAGLA